MLELATTHGTRYRPTETDRLWLARAVEAEGEPREAVARALVTRFLWLLEQDPRTYPTLTQFVRAYSQPVNPRWTDGGDKWEAARSEYSPGEQERILARRRLARTRTQFTPETLSAVDAALEVDNAPALATDFAAPIPANRERVKSWAMLVQPGKPGVNDLFRSKAVPAAWGYIASGVATRPSFRPDRVDWNAGSMAAFETEGVTHGGEESGGTGGGRSATEESAHRAYEGEGARGRDSQKGETRARDPHQDRPASPRQKSSYYSQAPLSDRIRLRLSMPPRKGPAIFVAVAMAVSAAGAVYAQHCTGGPHGWGQEP